MNRLTKKISLVLVSGTLAMGGCHEEPPRLTPERAEKDDPQGQNGVVSGSGGAGGVHSGSTYHGGHTSVVPIFVGGGSHSGVRPSSGLSASPSARSGFHSGSTTSHSVGGSSRGGFGSSGHAVSS